MKSKPYWATSNIKEMGLDRSISSSPPHSLDQILQVKREAAIKACNDILKKDRKAELIAVLGSVAIGDILGWFSDIDMLVITDRSIEEEMIEINHQVLFIEYHNWSSFEDLIKKKIVRDEFEERSSYLLFYSNPLYLYSPEESRSKYEEILNSGIESLWRDYSEIEEYLDDFVWFYGSAREAFKYNKPLTALGKLQRGTILMLRHYLIKNKILLRKPLPDERTIIQLRNANVPTQLVNFIEKLYSRELDLESLLENGKKMYLQVTNKRKWLNKIPL
jgi:predicted nucleotidyltransferase